ncbi:MAG TPA: hypothetical protein VM734_18910 [Kofleriaceae bacterium]|nr:hypothetical protein [Kofleriaceae bacterium]
MYQLCLGGETFASVVDRIVDRACAAAPTLDREACRRLVELVFRARVRKTEACGRHPECRPDGSLWGTQGAGDGEVCVWEDFDPRGLPAMFGAAAADLVAPLPGRRRETEQLLAAAFRSVFARLVYCNPRCGSAAVCHAEPVFPFPSLRRGRR